MVPLQVTADLPHGVCVGTPWGISLDGLLASVLWHRRKAAAAARGEVLTYDPLGVPEDLELPACHEDRWRAARPVHQRVQA